MTRDRPAYLEYFYRKFKESRPAGSLSYVLRRRFSQEDDGGTPSAVLRVVQCERDDFRMFFQKGMDGAAQVADAFPVDEAHLKNSARAALRQIFQHDILDLRRFERVQIQDAVDRELNGFVHGLNLPRFLQMERIASDPLIGLKQITAMRCTIKPMTLADYDEVVHLWQNSEGVGLSESDTRGEIGKFLKRNRGMSLVAREGKHLVGAILCGHDGRRACLYHLAVAPSHRRKGLGTKLVSRCLEHLKKAGVARCNVFFFVNNKEGERFWRKLGWKKRSELCMAQRIVGSPPSDCGC